MEVIKEIDGFYQLFENSWSGAKDTLRQIENADKEDELMEYLEDVFCGSTPTETELNDFLWFESEQIYEALGLDENGEIPNIAWFDIDAFIEAIEGEDNEDEIDDIRFEIESHVEDIDKLTEGAQDELVAYILTLVDMDEDDIRDFFFEAE